MVSNDELTLTPQTDLDGAVLEFDFPGVAVGIAEYEEGPTGCTVVRLPPGGAATAIDVRGGLVGITGQYEWNHALCLAGGSLYGLEAAVGVSRQLAAEATDRLASMPLVSGAIIYDYGIRENRIHPDRELGRAATVAAREGRLPLGRRGAGRGATVGKLFYPGEPGGQGAAFAREGDTRLLVCTVVNALGCIVGRDGVPVRGHLDPHSGRRLRSAEVEAPAFEFFRRGKVASPATSTTLTVLITNVRLDRRELTQLGRQVHASMARAIDPIHALDDGDVLFSVTTGEVDDGRSLAELGVVASELAWDAVLAAVADPATAEG
jgi:L-aminopeptidase/D-esterase-like protein